MTPHESVQLLYFSAQGSFVFVAANIIATPPLIMTAATQIFVFTPEILHGPSN
ncbi:MAG TPA: hypothetical protein VH188_07715 [Chthoniobacterales bacterium]|nr:hypothetical protein [Chthoniobacterales bacterium]